MTKAADKRPEISDHDEHWIDLLVMDVSSDQDALAATVFNEMCQTIMSMPEHREGSAFYRIEMNNSMKWRLCLRRTGSLMESFEAMYLRLSGMEKERDVALELLANMEMEFNPISDALLAAAAEVKTVREESVRLSARNEELSNLLLHASRQLERYKPQGADTTAAAVAPADIPYPPAAKMEFTKDAYVWRDHQPSEATAEAGPPNTRLVVQDEVRVLSHLCTTRLKFDDLAEQMHLAPSQVTSSIRFLEQQHLINCVNELWHATAAGKTYLAIYERVNLRPAWSVDLAAIKTSPWTVNLSSDAIERALKKLVFKRMIRERESDSDNPHWSF